MRGAVAAWVEDDVVAGGVQRAVGFPGKFRIAQHFPRLQLKISQLKFTAFRWPVHVSRLPFNDGALVGMIPTCPHFESDGVTESPLAGQAVIANLYPGLYEVVAAPAVMRRILPPTGITAASDCCHRQLLRIARRSKGRGYVPLVCH